MYFLKNMLTAFLLSFCFLFSNEGEHGVADSLARAQLCVQVLVVGVSRQRFAHLMNRIFHLFALLRRLRQTKTKHNMTIVNRQVSSKLLPFSPGLILFLEFSFFLGFFEVFFNLLAVLSSPRFRLRKSTQFLVPNLQPVERST